MKDVEGELNDLKRKFGRLKSEHKQLKSFTKVYEASSKTKFQRVANAHTDLREQHGLPEKAFDEPSPFKESYQRFKSQDSDSDSGL